MPDLDVSEILTDPDLASSFDVVRRVEGIDSHGRSVLVPTTTEGVLGVVCAASGNDLDRLDDSQRMGRNFSVVTKFRLQGPSPNQQPDAVVYQGDTYVVKLVEPYNQYGAGFVQAIIGSMDIIDQAIP